MNDPDDPWRVVLQTRYLYECRECGWYIPNSDLCVDNLVCPGCGHEFMIRTRLGG